MKAYEISREEIKDLEPICEGYKAVNYDLSTRGDMNFRYGQKGENIIGKIFHVEGKLEACDLGLHFSKDPANVFKYYKPLGYNRYFKVRAYGKCVDGDGGRKTVASTIEFVKEYDVLEFADVIKKYSRSMDYNIAVANNSSSVSKSIAVISSTAVYNSKAVNDSNAVDCSNAVYNSKAVNDSNAVSYSNVVNCSNAVSYSNVVSYSSAVTCSTAVNHSNAVNDSTAVNYSSAVNYSNAVSYSYGLRNCKGAYNSIFCVNKNGICNYLFNKKSNKKRIDEVKVQLLKFAFAPHFTNWYDVKGQKEWYAFCFPELKSIDNKTAWNKMPQEMLDYIKSLPEYDEEVFNKIVDD